jgi:hypothetical protein
VQTPKTVRQYRQSQHILSRPVAGNSTIDAVASNGPPDNFHKQQTQYANYGLGGQPPSGGPPPAFQPPAAPEPDQQVPPDSPDPFDQETEPRPWYRKPAGIIAWVIAVLILLGLIAYGITELIQGGQGTSPAPSTSTTPTTGTTTTTPPTTTTTESSETPPTSSAVAPPTEQPTQQPTHQPTQPPPTHRHHLPFGIPSVITIPGMPTPITLPPGLGN